MRCSPGEKKRKEKTKTSRKKASNTKPRSLQKHKFPYREHMLTTMPRFSANTPRPNQPLDMIKFLCKDLWTLVFRKQIDNLKTNHRGTFVLTDARFPPLARMSVDRGRGPRGLEEALSQSQAVRNTCFLSTTRCSSKRPCQPY